MARKLIVAPEVEQDLSIAYHSYESCRLGLGEDFLSSVDACVQRLSRMPESYQLIGGQVRRALTRRFPYSIFFELIDETIFVYMRCFIPRVTQIIGGRDFPDRLNLVGPMSSFGTLTL